MCILAGNAGASAFKPDPVRIVLLTMGPGESLVTRLGHAALCVVDKTKSEPRCFNYGAISARAGLARDIVLGRARFHVRVEPYSVLMRHYIADNRSIYAQDIPLSDKEIDRVITQLKFDSRPENREYLYNPFTNNCATRIRDVLSNAPKGVLSDAKDHSSQKTYRSMSQPLVYEQRTLRLALQLISGRELDEPLSDWKAMFVPSELRLQIAQRYEAQPRVLHQGVRAKPKAASLWFYLLWLSFPLAALASLLLWAGGRFWTFGMIIIGAVLVTASVVPWGMVVLSDLSQIRVSLGLLIFCPTDLAIIALPWAGLTNSLVSRWIRLYLVFRFASLSLLGLAAIAGISTTAQLPFTLSALLLLGAAFVGMSLRSRRKQHL